MSDMSFAFSRRRREALEPVSGAQSGEADQIQSTDSVGMPPFLSSVDAGAEGHATPPDATESQSVIQPSSAPSMGVPLFLRSGASANSPATQSESSAQLGSAPSTGVPLFLRSGASEDAHPTPSRPSADLSSAPSTGVPLFLRSGPSAHADEASRPTERTPAQTGRQTQDATERHEGSGGQEEHSASSTEMPARPDQPLDLQTAQRIEQTTGERVPGDVRVSENDPKADAAGVPGMADGNVIRLSTNTPGADTEQGLEVRLHEAIHQIQLSKGPGAAGGKSGVDDVERDAIAVARAALAGRRRPVEVPAEGGQAYNFTRLLDPLQTQWDTATEMATSPVPAAARETQSREGTVPLEPGAAATSGHEAPLPAPQANQDAHANEDLRPRTDNAPEPVERPVHTQPRRPQSGNQGEGQQDSAKAREEQDRAHRRISAQVDQLSASAPPPDSGPTPVGHDDSRRPTRARQEWQTGSAAELRGARDETRRDFGEQGLASETDPHAELDPQVTHDLETPEVDVVDRLGPEVVQTHLGPDAIGIGLAETTMFDPEKFQDWISGEQITQVGELSTKVQQERQDKETELRTLRADAQSREQGIRNDATANVDAARTRWRQSQDSDLQRASVEVEGVVTRQTTEAQGHVSEGDRRSAQAIRQGRADADGRMAGARRRAEAKRQESESPSWLERGWDWIKEKASAVVDWVRDMYARARRWARQRLAEARRAARRFIERARELATRAYDALDSALGGKLTEWRDRLTQLASDALDAIGDFIADAQAALNRFAQALAETFRQWGQAIREGLGTVLEWGEELLDSALDALGGLAELLLSWIEARYPTLAQMIRTGSLQPLFDLIAEGVASVLQEVLDTLGISEFIDGLDSIIQALGGGEELQAALTGDADAFERVLERLLAKLDEFLASDRFQEWKAQVEQQNAEQDESTLDALVSIMDFVRDYVGPAWKVIESVIAGIQGAIDYAGQLLGDLVDWVKEKISAALDIVLESDIYQAIAAKLTEWWDAAARGVNALVEKIKAGWALFRSFAIDPLIEAWNALKRLWTDLTTFAAEVWERGKTWLAEISEQIVRAVKDALEPVVEFIDSVKETISQIVDSVLSWARELLVVQIAVAAFALLVAAARAIAAPIVERLTRAVELVRQGWEMLKAALSWLAKNLGPILDFVVGLIAALTMLVTMANPLPLALFIVSNIWRAIPEGYRKAIVKFILEVVIRVLEAAPAPAQYDFMGRFIKAALLGFLRQLRQDEEELRAALMTFANVWGGRGAAEFMLGFLVGVAKGVWEGTIGSLVFLVEILGWLGKLALGAMGVDFDSTDDSESAAQPPEPDAEEPEQEDPSEAAEETQEAESDGQQGSEESGGDDAADGASPQAPADLAQGFDLFKQFLRKAVTDGFTRAELQALLDSVGTNVDSLGERAGQAAAAQLIAAIRTLAENAYEMGDIVGQIVGTIVTELVIAYFTAGAGAGLSAGKWALKLGKAAPKVLALLKKAKRILAPVFRVFERIKGVLARWARKVSRWIDDLLDWFRRKLSRRRRGPGSRRRRRDNDNDDNDNSAETRAARRVADAAWRRAQAATRSEAKTKGEIERHIANLGGRQRGGINVELRVHESGRRTWKIRATATARGDLVGKRATRPRAGGGWIALPDGAGRKKYLAEDLSSFNRDLLREAARTLEAFDEGDGTLRSQYNHNVQEARRLERQFQGRLDQRVRGLRFTIDMEGIARVEDDERIKTDLKIAPNAEKLQVDIPLDDGTFDDLLAALRRSPGNREFPMLDRLERLLQTKAREHNCTVRITPYRRGGYSHRAIFSRGADNLELPIRQTQANTDCPSCGRPDGESVPHNVVSRANIRSAIVAAMGRINPRYVQDGVTQQIIGHARGRRAATEGEHQRQCRTCEDSQGPFSLIQRRGGAADVGDQFDNSSPTEDRDLTRTRIARICDLAEQGTRDQAALNPGHWVNTQIVAAGRLPRFKESIRRQLWREVR